MNESLRLEFDRVRQQALAVGGVALVLCVAAAFSGPAQFFRSYLLAFVFWTGIALGCAAILMLHHLVGGTWGFSIRRLLEAGTGTFRLMALLFAPLLLGLFRFHLYRWSKWLPREHPYLNAPFFLARTAAYFVLWVVFAHFLEKWSLEQDRSGDPELVQRLQRLSGPGLLVYGLTVTYMSVDWVMSLEPEWFSTIYGMIFMVTQTLSAMALVTIVAALLADRKPLSDVMSPLLFNDYGNLLLTFTLLWAYLAFSQYLIIWSGNLQDEIPWYVVRASGGWAWVALLLIVFHFAVPFLLLLSRSVKRRARVLGGIALGLIVMGVIDIYWLVTPAFYRQKPELHVMDFLALAGIGGIWIWDFLSHLKEKPLLPLHDPRFDGSPAPEHYAHG